MDSSSSSPEADKSVREDEAHANNHAKPADNSDGDGEATSDSRRWAASRRRSESSDQKGGRRCQVSLLAVEGVRPYGERNSSDQPGANARGGRQSSSTFDCPGVVPLNVGGVSYITRRSTLLKEPESMLAAMFSGRHEMQRDRHGYYFIDTNGVYFGYILDYLRHGKLPPNEVALPVYQEAGYFGLAGLQEALSVSPSVTREIVRQRHEEQFLDYAGLRARVISAAVEVGAVTRCADVLVWPHRVQTTPQHASCVAETAHVKFGPWPGQADEETLMRSLHADLSEAGYNLTPLEKKRCKFFVSGQTCTRLAYKLSFKFT